MTYHKDEISDIADLPIDDGHDRITSASTLRTHLDRIAFKQHNLASSFLHVGNEHVAAQLFRWSQEIAAIADKWSKIEGTGLSDQLKTSQELSATILQTALAGLTIGKETK